MRRNLALILALCADAIQFVITPMVVFGGIGEMIDVAIDVFMAGVLSMLLGFHWVYLPTFVAEAIPGVNLMPLWTGAVLFTWNRKPTQAQEPKPITEVEATVGHEATEVKLLRDEKGRVIRP